MAEGSDSRMTVDAKVLSAGMMYRSRRRRRHRKANEGITQHHAESGAEEEMFMDVPSSSPGSFEHDDNNDEGLIEYVTRDLQPDMRQSNFSLGGASQLSPVGAPLAGAAGACLSGGGKATLAERRMSLQRRTSMEGENQLKEVIMRLEELGDSIDGDIQTYINSALKELAIEYGEGVSYSGYRGVVAKMFKEFSASWKTVAAVYRMSDDLLEEVEETTGSEDHILQTQLQDHNVRAIMDVAGDFLSKVGGLTAILTAKQEDLYGPETEL
eukprot:scpid40011/ scgid28553/ 